MASSSGSDDGALLDKEEARPAWDPVPAVAPGHCAAVMGDEDLWPPLLPGSSTVTPASAARAPSSSAAPAAPAGRPEPTISTTSNEENLGSSSGGRHGDRDAPAAVPAGSSSSPMHASSNHAYGAGFRGRQNGRFVAQHPPHGRGSVGHNGGRRPPADGANGRGDVNVHVHINGNGYGNFNGGGFNNGQRRGGRSHHPTWNPHGGGRHWPSSPQRAHLHGYPQLSLPPPPLPPPPPPLMGMPYYDNYMAYRPYASYSPEFAHGFHFPSSSQEEPLFMPYAAFPMYNMMPHQQAPAGQQQVQEQQDAPPTLQELQTAIRKQIEYYFSKDNLIKDIYLRSKMDEEGWVPLSVIAGFPRIKNKSTDLDFITASVLPSDDVEVQDGKVRRRTGWEEFLLPRSS